MIGIDIVQISSFAMRMRGEGMMEKIFTSEELSHFKDAQSLAGVFAVKEAFYKALGRTEDWHSVWVEKEDSGKPRLFSTLLMSEQRVDVSISHDGDYAVAVVVIGHL